MRGPALLALLLLLGALWAPAAQAAAPPRASLPDIEDEVMCLECGTQLNVSTSAVADSERRFISDLIAQGRTKAEIKAILVQEFGPDVLAQPRDEGFGLAGWLVPLLAVPAALALVLLLGRRWRARPVARGFGAGAPALSAGDARRLDDELDAFGR